MKLLSNNPLQLELTWEEYRTISSAVSVASGSIDIQTELDASGASEKKFIDLVDEIRKITKQIVGT